MSYAVSVLIAWAALVVIYHAFARSLRMSVPSTRVTFQRKQLFVGYFAAILLAVWSGFRIATLSRQLGHYSVIGACLSFLLAAIIGYVWARHRLGEAYVDSEATERMLESASDVREFDDTSQRERLQQTTIPGQPAWKVLLFLASLQALGALVGYVTVVLTS